MDPSTVLEETTQDVSNLRAEFKFIMDEIKSNDFLLFEKKKKLFQRESQLQKFGKQQQQGQVSENGKEAEMLNKLKSDVDMCENVQGEKCILANTALFLITKHLNKLQKSIQLLEEENLLAPLEDDKEADSGGEVSRESSVMSSAGERKRKQTPLSSVVKKKKKTERGSSRNREGTPVGGLGSDSNFDLNEYNDDLFSGMNQNEEDDKQLYCFCHSISYGEMVACDGANCKYEWFHYGCVNLKEPPKGQWYCPDCRQELASSRLKKKKI
ncbi:LAMI_0C01090g1_1 [Lachancea mirantina]|uniref:Chromatin modification-related protein n=1 Tax=Lachancea mirantina TaxID=1230905 RepID=A0A1G4IZW1_9SACH|nr:LAMI_0C01090g1_1 [Lachancea mirantina]